MDELRLVADRALELWKLGDVTRAEPLFWQCWQARHPDWSPLDHPEYGAPARLSLGVALAMTGDQDAAVREFQRVSDLSRPDVSPMARFNLGLAAQNQGRLGEAIEHYQVAVDSGHPETARLAQQNLDLLARPALMLNLGLELAAALATMALWFVGDRSMAWSTWLGSFVCGSTILKYLLALGPLRPNWRRVGLGLRLATAGVSVMGVVCLTIGLVTSDPEGIAVGATLIVGGGITAQLPWRG